MRSALLAAAASFALVGSAWADAPSGHADDEPLIKDPDWLAAPSFKERMDAYPKAALDAGVGGETALRCKVKPDGQLAGCALARETPAGMGFGQAALALADRFRMKPEAIPSAAPGMTEPVVLVPVRWAIVEEPDWARTPSGVQLEGLYPAGARNQRMPGVAQVRCEVKTDGTLANCFTLFEAPKGMGFGDASLRATRYFRMKPAKLDGQPVAGGMVTIPLHWEVAGGGNQVQVGDDAVLVVALKPGVKQSKYIEVRCATAAAKAQTCLAIPAPWRQRPANSQVWEVMKRRHADTGVASLACRVGDDGALQDCKASGHASPDKEAAMRELAAGLKAAPEAQDGVPTHGQLVLVPFDWAQLRRAAEPAPGAAH